MAILINGNGNKAIWAAQDADLIASICGNVTAIAAVGSQFSYTQEDANTLGVADGVIITKEGRRIQLDTGNVDLFTIPTGTLGIHSYYIIGYKLIENEDSSQTCETFVQKMDNATDVITEDTFKGGATEVYVSLYRIDQDGMTIDTVDLLLPMMNNLTNAGGGGMPDLDFAHPLHVFYTSIPSGEYAGQTYGLTFTATEECYLLGGFVGNIGSVVKIDGTAVGESHNFSGSHNAWWTSGIKLNAGNVVTVTTGSPNLHVFKPL